jgi:hypothetical protein
VESTNQVSCLINSLTNDEDLRQELWVHYLSGHSTNSFDIYLEKIKFEYCDDIELKEAIWALIKNPPSDALLGILDNFTDFERSIICLLMLGLDVDKISAAKGISEVRIRQSIATIRYNNVWKEKYGIKEKPDRRRKVRSQRRRD